MCRHIRMGFCAGVSLRLPNMVAVTRVGPVRTGVTRSACGRNQDRRHRPRWVSPVTGAGESGLRDLAAESQRSRQAPARPPLCSGCRALPRPSLPAQPCQEACCGPPTRGEGTWDRFPGLGPTAFLHPVPGRSNTLSVSLPNIPAFTQFRFVLQPNNCFS